MDLVLFLSYIGAALLGLVGGFILGVIYHHGHGHHHGGHPA